MRQKKLADDLLRFSRLININFKQYVLIQVASATFEWRIIYEDKHQIAFDFT